MSGLNMKMEYFKMVEIFSSVFFFKFVTILLSLIWLQFDLQFYHIDDYLR